MSDDIDRAQEREQEMRQDALDKHARRAQSVAGESAIECVLCGEPIAEGRRQALPGVATCIECQAFCERFGYWGAGE